MTCLFGVKLLPASETVVPPTAVAGDALRLAGEAEVGQGFEVGVGLGGGGLGAWVGLGPGARVGVGDEPPTGRELGVLRGVLPGLGLLPGTGLTPGCGDVPGLT